MDALGILGFTAEDVTRFALVVFVLFVSVACASVATFLVFTNTHKEK